MVLTSQHLTRINLARYSFTLRARRDAILPPFLGSTLRGSFGHALKKVACSIPHGDCRRCLLVDRCAYPRLFETAQLKSTSLLKNGQAAPRPFVFVPPLPGPPQGLRARDDLLTWRMGVAAGQLLTFGLTLICEAIDDLPYVVCAVDLMAQKGIGVDRTPFDLLDVSILTAEGEAKVVYASGSSRVANHDACHYSLSTLVELRLAEMAQSHALKANIAAVVGNLSQGVHHSTPKLTLSFLTPTRLRSKNQIVETPSFGELVTSLSLRLSMLAANSQPITYDYKSMVELAKTVRTSNSTLQLMHLDRYSNHQSAKLSLDGFMGEITFSHSQLYDFLPLLVVGEFLNLGSATAFGLGRYQVFQ